MLKLSKLKLISTLVRSKIFDADYIGEQLGKSLTRVQAAKAYINSNELTANRYFSNEFYLNTYRDVAEAGVDPFVHFLQNGAREFRACHPDLDMEFIESHLQKNGDKQSNYLQMICTEVASQSGISFEAFCNGGISPATSEEEKEIFASGLFDEDFYLGQYPDIKKGEIEPVYHYLHFGHKEDRNPSTKFDTKFYRDSLNKKTDAAPLVHYIRSGEGETLPSHAVQLDQSEPASFSKKVAIQVHLFYPDILSELLPLFVELDVDFDLLISLSEDSDLEFVKTRLDSYGMLTRADIRVVENVGRDIAPLFVGFADAWKKYEYICHLHSKKSPHCHFGHRWRTYLFDQLIGSSSKTRAVLEQMDNDDSVAVMYPENYFEIKKFANDNGNEKAISKLLKKMSLTFDKKLLSNDFPAGSMCWVKTSAFQKLVDLKLTLEDFQEESGQLEGTLAHALERGLAIIPELQGKKALKYYGNVNNPQRLKLKWNNPDSFAPKVSHHSKWMRDTADIAINERLDLAPKYNVFNPNSLSMHWIIPDFGKGAGGHMTIFRMVRYLEEAGHRHMIWVQNCNNYKTPAEAKKCIQEHYQPIGEGVIVQFLPEDVSHISGDVIIASDCWTVFPMMAMSQFKERFYLIQDWEPMFHAVGAEHLIADLTYDLGLNALCAGKWLDSKAKERGMWSRAWDLATDELYYYPEQKVRNDKDFRIAFYARAYTPRRAVMLGVAALRELHKRGYNFHVDFFGQEGLDFGVEFSHEYLGIMSPEQLGDLYRDSDLGVVFSATNYSLIPLEMMACKLPILELDVDSTQAVFDNSYVEMTKADPLLIANKLEELLNKRGQLSYKAEKAYQKCQEVSWKESALKIESAVIEKLEEKFKAVTKRDLFSGKSYDVKASVIIPTFNAGDDFKPVLQALIEQKCDFEYEIVIVDSGSSDNTVELINSFNSPLIKLHHIPNSEFQHGRTRNFAISKSVGELVAVMTQDATPKDENWLNELVKVLDNNPDAVGAFGRHEAYSQHSKFVQRDIERVFERFDMFGERYNWKMKSPDIVEAGSLAWQHMLQFYSDNSSCMRKSVWEYLPYPEIDWGEDQAWAWMIVQLGFTKVYAEKSVILHSHDDTPESKYKTAMAEGKFFKEAFGMRFYSDKESLEKLIEHEQAADKAYGLSVGIESSVIDNQKELVKAAHEGRFEGNS